MGMAAYGVPIFKEHIKETLIECMDAPNFRLRRNVHKGILGWEEQLGEEYHCDIAASIQSLTEDFMVDLARYAKKATKSKNLVLMGGCALNCVANEKIAKERIFDDLWIMPNPGDAGNSLGAILAYTRQKANWVSPYLGTAINRTFNVGAALEALETDKIIAIATGRAEFGPRALGNRSLIADPRGNEIKDKVNDIKQRQRFRPFAPIILEHLAHDYFEMPVLNSPYMQFTAKCKFPDEFPAICHADGSSRVQTLTRAQNPEFYALLESFYEKTGCPILLNTSLNIKGEPLVNTWQDAKRFSQKYDVKVF
jgi:carbamoyltransferase